MQTSLGVKLGASLFKGLWFMDTVIDFGVAPQVEMLKWFPSLLVQSVDDSVLPH